MNHQDCMATNAKKDILKALEFIKEQLEGINE